MATSKNHSGVQWRFNWGSIPDLWAENTAVVNVNSVDVVDFYRTVTQLGIELWIDGGWGVDALLSEQTRPHKDLDIAIQQKDVAALREFLRTQSYREAKA